MTGLETQTTEKKELDPRDAAALEVIQTGARWAFGVGIVPIPVLDMIGVTAVQVKMIQDLTKIYEVPYSENSVKNILGAIIGGASSLATASVLGSLAKMVPGVGSVAAVFAVPGAAGATTWAAKRSFG